MGKDEEVMATFLAAALIMLFMGVIISVAFFAIGFVLVDAGYMALYDGTDAGAVTVIFAIILGLAVAWIGLRYNDDVAVFLDAMVAGMGMGASLEGIAPTAFVGGFFGIFFGMQLITLGAWLYYQYYKILSGDADDEITNLKQKDAENFKLKTL